MAKWLVLGRLFFDSGTEYQAAREVIHPDYVYEGRVLTLGYVDKSIPVPSGLPQLGDCRIRIADTDRKFRDLLYNQTPRRRFLDLRLVREGFSESDQTPFATFEIFDAEFGTGDVEFYGRDTTFAWIDKQIPGLINRTNFPDLLENIDEAFMPIIAGVLDFPSQSSPPNPQGVLTLPRMTLRRWGLAQHPILYVELCGQTDPAVEFALINQADYVITEEVHVIDGVSYTLSFIDFNSDQDLDLTVRCRIVEGFYTRGAFGSMPAVINSPLTALRNPIDLLINILYVTLQTETRIAQFNVDSFADVRLLFESLIASESPAAPYACDGAIDRPITVRQFLEQFLTSFEMDLFVNREGLITVNLTTETDPDRPLFSDGPVFGSPTDNSLILRNSMRQRLANPTCNRLKFNYSLNYSTDEFAAKEVLDDLDGQEALGGQTSPLIPFVEEEVVEFRFVRDALTAADVARRRLEFLGLGSYRVEFKLPLPEVFDDLELAKLIGITHYWGLADGGFINIEAKVTGLTYELDQLLCTVRGVLRRPLPITQRALEYEGEALIEALDSGLRAATTTSLFYRSIFNLPNYPEGTEYFLEIVGDNTDSIDAVWTVFNVDILGEPDMGSGQTITVPAGTAQKRIRNVTPFIPNTDPAMTSSYMVRAPAVTGGQEMRAYRLRVVVDTPVVTEMHDEICLSNFGGSDGIDQTIGGGDIFRTAHSGPEDMSGDGDFGTMRWASVGGPIWTYHASAWDNIATITFLTVLANVTFDGGNLDEWSEAALVDIDDPDFIRVIVVSTRGSSDVFLNPRQFFGFIPVGNLIDGHRYREYVRSVNRFAPQSNDFNTYFHKGRLQIHVSPIRNMEIHSRCGFGTESVIYYPGASADVDVVFEGQDDATPSVTVGLAKGLQNLGTSDTATSGTIVAQANILPGAIEARTPVNIQSKLTPGNRYLSTASDISYLIQKIPASLPTSFTPTSPYLQYLIDQGFPPIRLLEFQEGTGVPVEHYTSLPVTIVGSPTWVTNSHGSAYRLNAVNSTISLGINTDFLQPERGTILIIRRKTTTTPPSGGAIFGVMSSDSAARISGIVGRNDNVTAVECDGTINMPTPFYVPTTDVEAWLFRYGGWGKSIWKDGVMVASTVTTCEINSPDVAADFLLNRWWFDTGDVQEFNWFAAIPFEVSDEVAATFTPDNVLL